MHKIFKFKNMKRIILLSGVSILLTLMVIACSKDKTNTNIETPGKSTIANNTVVDTFYTMQAGSIESGFKFYSLKNGKITKIGCKMPEKGDYRVSLWDYTSKGLISATTISVTDSTQFTYNNVSPIDVTANTRYVISINNTSAGSSKRLFVFFKKPGINSIYPISTGSITYEALQEVISTTSTFPTDVIAWDQNYFAGVPDFQIEYDE